MEFSSRCIQVERNAVHFVELMARSSAEAFCMVVVCVCVCLSV